MQFFLSLLVHLVHLVACPQQMQLILTQKIKGVFLIQKVVTVSHLRRFSGIERPSKQRKSLWQDGRKEALACFNEVLPGEAEAQE